MNNGIEQSVVGTDEKRRGIMGTKQWNTKEEMGNGTIETLTMDVRRHS